MKLENELHHDSLLLASLPLPLLSSGSTYELDATASVLYQASLRMIGENTEKVRKEKSLYRTLQGLEYIILPACCKVVKDGEKAQNPDDEATGILRAGCRGGGALLEKQQQQILLMVEEGFQDREGFGNSMV
ncbi:hypothetical protein P7K49_008065 [Saguinus oedipus]|uniref:Uncharacterized protein n=1 Tax=Saguinus oedipus TaxID=9490 RepID=A0ABQ9VY99_SAGOE|nr:hypothetical protein P7K49_008065 [Saguinus oedipus]